MNPICEHCGYQVKETFENGVRKIDCPCCGANGIDDSNFSTEHTKVTYQGIVIVLECKHCDEIFVPQNQRLGIVDSGQLKMAVSYDSEQSGEPLYENIDSVLMNAEKLNAFRKGEVH